MRSYKQFCGVAKALDVVGGRWTLLIIRELIPGPRRYSDMMESLWGITTNLLAARLRMLVEEGIVSKTKLPAPSGSTVYVLTPLGCELIPVIQALGSFGANYLTSPQPHERRDIRWLGVSLIRRFVGSDLAPFRIQLDAIGDSVVKLHVHWDGRVLRTRDGEHPADVRLRGAVGPVLALFAPLERLEVVGDREVAETFLANLRPIGAEIHRQA